MSSIAQINTLIQEYQAFQNSLSTAQMVLDNVVAQGTVIFNDATLMALFPNTAVAYKAWLVSLGSSITTFRNSIPAPPSLNG